MIEYREAAPDELDSWDDLTVRIPGGHVLQSRGWAEHEQTKGWAAHFLVGDDGSAVVALTRPQAVVGGRSAYIPRGPVPTGNVSQAIRRLEGVTRWLHEREVDVVASDAEVLALGYRDELESIGYRPIEEIQPSRHRLSVHLGEHPDETAVMGNVSKSTRQRIHQAEREGLRVVRHDPHAADGTQSAAAYVEFETPDDPIDVALNRFHELASGTADRRDFALGSRGSFLDWTTRAWAGGHLVLLEAVEAVEGGSVIAGLMLYRHGGRLSTALSGDRPDARTTHPGAFHLLRWRAIQLAIREYAWEMDLGGVDVAGARHEPKPGDPMHGLYMHKRSFGAEWIELPGAHERQLNPTRYVAGRVAGGLLSRLKRVMG